MARTEAGSPTWQWSEQRTRQEIGNKENDAGTKTCENGLYKFLSDRRAIVIVRSHHQISNGRRAA